MDKEQMAAMIRHAACEFLNDQKYAEKKLYIPDAGYSWDQERGTCFWFFVNKPHAAKRMILKKVGKFLLGQLVGLGALGLGAAYADNRVVSNFAESVHHGMQGREAAEAFAPNIDESANEALGAVAYEAAQATEAEIAISLNSYWVGGNASFLSRNGDNQTLMFWDRCTDKDNFTARYEYIQEKWKYTQDLDTTWRYGVGSSAEGFVLYKDGTYGKLKGNRDTYIDYDGVKDLPFMQR